jgi:hypothetical protein
MISSFLQFVKNELPKEKNNYAAVIIKELIESGFDDEIREGKRQPYLAKPPISPTEEIHKKLTHANLKKPNFDANEAAKSTLSILKPFVSVGQSKVYSLTLEFNATSIPEILKICDQEISLK